MRSLAVCLLMLAFSGETIAAPPLWQRVCERLWKQKPKNIERFLAFQGTWVEPDPAAAGFPDEAVIERAREYFTVETFRTDLAEAGPSNPPLSQIVVLASPKKFGIDVENGHKVLDELLTRHPVVVVAFHADPTVFESARQKWFDGQAAANDEEKVYYAYLNQASGAVNLPGAQALTRRVRNFKNADKQKLFVVPSAETAASLGDAFSLTDFLLQLGPVKLGNRWSYRLRTAGEVFIGGFLIVYGVGALTMGLTSEHKELLWLGLAFTGVGGWIAWTGHKWSRIAKAKDASEIARLRAQIVDLQNAYAEDSQAPQTLLVIADDTLVPAALRKVFE